MENIIEKLKRLVIEKKDEFPYINIENWIYMWWVSNFWFKYNNKSINLNLNNEDDLFILFILAIWWSRSWNWENPAVLCAYIKENNKGNYTYWINNDNILYEKYNSKLSAKISESLINGSFKPRKRISFRSDIFDSIHILANNWNTIIYKLYSINNDQDSITFMNYMRSIKWLWTNNNKILIKIPLILRELRCQKININIRLVTK